MCKYRLGWGARLEAQVKWLPSPHQKKKKKTLNIKINLGANWMANKIYKIWRYTQIIQMIHPKNISIANNIKFTHKHNFQNFLRLYLITCTKLSFNMCANWIFRRATPKPEWLTKIFPKAVSYFNFIVFLQKIITTLSEYNLEKRKRGNIRQQCWTVFINPLYYLVLQLKVGGGGLRQKSIL